MGNYGAMMGKTKNFILMCEKSYDDLFPLLKEVRPGTIVMFPDDKFPRMILHESEVDYAEKLYRYNIINLSTGTSYNSNKIMEDGFIIWQQDQLQGMIEKSIYDNIWDFYEFSMFDIGPESIVSMEQLWLAYVMKEKYNKIWTGQDWRKADL